MVKEVVVIDAVRSPCGIRTTRRYSDICRVMPDELLAYCLKGLIERNNIDPAIIDDIICGTSDRPHNSGRIASLMAGFPPTVAGCQVNRQCAGSHSALHFAAFEIMVGYSDITVACGVESMSRDFDVDREAHPTQSRRGAPVPPDYVPDMLVEVWRKYSPTGMPVTMGQSAEAIAHKYGFTRDELDDFSFWSQQKAIKATQEGKFKKEIVPIPVKMPDGTVKVVDVDETIRFDVDRERMKTLPSSFIPPPFMGITEGKITAGNSAPVSDGACAALLMSREKAKELGLEPKAVLRADRFALVGVDPGPYQLTGPIPATQKVLRRSGFTLEKIEWFEVNEAFSSVVLAWCKEMGVDPFDPRLNPHGGAIALGHPLGETGVKLLATAIHGMEDKDAKYALITMCVGLGQGIATIVERET
ncbi:MAG: thiolase family protein [Candidatus Bathyarchaeia archaeon]